MASRRLSRCRVLRHDPPIAALPRPTYCASASWMPQQAGRHGRGLSACPRSMEGGLDGDGSANRVPAITAPAANAVTPGSRRTSAGREPSRDRLGPRRWCERDRCWQVQGWVLESRLAERSFCDSGGLDRCERVGEQGERDTATRRIPRSYGRGCVLSTAPRRCGDLPCGRHGWDPLGRRPTRCRRQPNALGTSETDAIASESRPV